MPADPSSPIPAALAQLARAAPLQHPEAGHLLAYLAAVPDPPSAWRATGLGSADTGLPAAMRAGQAARTQGLRA